MEVYVQCPACKGLVEVVEINCGIFRHAVRRDSGEAISPHTPRDECERLAREGEVWGCASPFRVIRDNTGKLRGIPSDD